MDGGHQLEPIDSSPSSHTSRRLDQADEHMTIDSDPPPTGIVFDDFLQRPMTYSPFPSPPPFDDMIPSSFSTSQSSPANTADEPATCAFTDYHLILNGKFIHSILSTAL